MGRLNRDSPLPDAARPRVEDPLIQRAFDTLATPLIEVIKFLTPFRQPEPWKDLTLYSDWARTSASLEGPQYVKDPIGRVSLRGWARTTAGTSSTVAVLPIGYRPRNRLSFACACISGASNVFCRVDVYPDGIVSFASPAVGANSEVSLSNVQFDTRL